MFLSPLRMSQQEIDAFPPSHVSATRYLAIRNTILLAWDASAKDKHLNWARLSGSFKALDRDRARKVFEFLHFNRYIHINLDSIPFASLRRKLPPNLGQLPYTVPAIPPWKIPRIFIIGAGISGLIAARTLVDAGFPNVTVLEARDRIGGRVCTAYTSQRCPIELGASFIHGTIGNPITNLAKKIGAGLYSPSPSLDLYDYDGSRVPRHLDENLESEWNRLLDRSVEARHGMELTHSASVAGGPVRKGWSLASGIEFLMKEELLSQVSNWKADQELSNLIDNGSIGSRDVKSPAGRSLAREERILNWHFANIEGPCAAPLEKLDLFEWDQDDAFEYEGRHCLITTGYGDLPRALALNLDVRLNHEVKSIDYTKAPGRGVQLEVSDAGGAMQLLEADYVVVTVPLGVLKTESIKFVPPLAKKKQQAIERLGFGLFNKVFLVFPEVFWNPAEDYIGMTGLVRGKFYMFLGLHKACRQPILMGYLAGTIAHTLEAYSDAEIVDDAMQSLRQIFSRDGFNVPWPTEVAVTRWASDPFAGGSYSFIESSAGAKDYDVMAEPASENLLFAGEHTCRRHPATVAGACRSGHREALRIINACKENYMGPMDALPSASKRAKTSEEGWIAVNSTETAFDAIATSEDDETEERTPRKAIRSRAVSASSIAVARPEYSTPRRKFAREPRPEPVAPKVIIEVADDSQEVAVENDDAFSYSMSSDEAPAEPLRVSAESFEATVLVQPTGGPSTAPFLPSVSVKVRPVFVL